ncbi:unnamed protein product [Caenorhabditis bovis]|uniref:Uncharacterized protein n=1 Tax=Caenorhabditis bovis TaxID=2654633 RepID=A0A8S1EPQ3_9PELO|nr:unnamed protein product [Caenorhabditis bovis]
MQLKWFSKESQKDRVVKTEVDEMPSNYNNIKKEANAVTDGFTNAQEVVHIEKQIKMEVSDQQNVLNPIEGASTAACFTSSVPSGSELNVHEDVVRFWQATLTYTKPQDRDHTEDELLEVLKSFTKFLKPN